MNITRPAILPAHTGHFLLCIHPASPLPVASTSSPSQLLLSPQTGELLLTSIHILPRGSGSGLTLGQASASS